MYAIKIVKIRSCFYDLLANFMMKCGQLGYILRLITSLKFILCKQTNI